MDDPLAAVAESNYPRYLPMEETFTWKTRLARAFLGINAWSSPVFIFDLAYQFLWISHRIGSKPGSFLLLALLGYVSLAFGALHGLCSNSRRLPNLVLVGFASLVPALCVVGWINGYFIVHHRYQINVFVLLALISAYILVAIFAGLFLRRHLRPQRQDLI